MNRYSERIFEVNLKKGTLDINKKEVRLIPEFKELLIRDKGGIIKGDPDGRRKYVATAEMLYIYITCDNFTMYSKLSDTKRERTALEISGLIDINWKEDKTIKAAKEAYKDIVKLSPISLALYNAQKSLHSIGRDLGMFENYNEKIRNEIKINERIIENPNSKEELKEEARQKIKAYFNDLSANNKEILNLSSSLNERYRNIEELKVKVAEEDNELEQIVGDRISFNREDPE